MTPGQEKSETLQLNISWILLGTNPIQKTSHFGSRKRHAISLPNLWGFFYYKNYYEFYYVTFITFILLLIINYSCSFIIIFSANTKPVFCWRQYHTEIFDKLSRTSDLAINLECHAKNQLCFLYFVIQLVT